MKNSSLLLRKAYYSLFSAIEFNGSLIEVYDELAPENAKFPCIVFSSQTNESQEPNKDKIGGLASITVQVVDKVLSKKTPSKLKIDEIETLILQAVRPQKFVFGVNAFPDFQLNFEVIGCDISTRRQILPVFSGYNVQKIIQLTHKLIER